MKIPLKSSTFIKCLCLFAKGILPISLRDCFAIIYITASTGPLYYNGVKSRYSNRAASINYKFKACSKLFWNSYCPGQHKLYSQSIKHNCSWLKILSIYSNRTITLKHSNRTITETYSQSTHLKLYSGRVFLVL